MMKLRALAAFYGSYAFASLIISLACVWIVFVYGLSPFVILFWFKVSTLVVIYLFVRGYKQKEFYYYANIGLSKKVLWIFSITFDMLLFLSLIILTAVYR